MVFSLLAIAVLCSCEMNSESGWKKKKSTFLKLEIHVTEHEFKAHIPFVMTKLMLVVELNPFACHMQD